MKQRETLGSRLGFILISVGCAVGIGNVWKFPWLVGQYGGGFFVLIYLVFLCLMGVPVMTMEFSIGRAAQKSPLKMYQEIEPKGTKWHFHGIICLVGNIILMMYYTTVAGWMVNYFVKMLTGTFKGMDNAAINQVYSDMTASPAQMVIFTVIVIVLGFLISSMSLQNGLERISKFMMSALIIIMIVLAVHSMLVPGGASGLEFYLKPDIARAKQAGLFNVIVSAMNQAFFTLSIGMGSMAIFGSYIGDDRSLMGESVTIAALDTVVAFTSGLIIFPACFAYGVKPDAGPSLIFKTLPNIFANMPGGRIWGALFFVFMSFAAFSTVIAVFENIVAMMMDLTGFERKKTSLICLIMMLVLSMPCALGFNVWSFVQPFGKGTGIMDLEDFLVSNLILPGGAVVFVLFCTWNKIGWGWDNFLNEANKGKGLKVAHGMRFYCTFILPVLIAFLIIFGLVTFFR